MTEHRKFPPVPDEGDAAPKGSLIERAVKSFDLTRFAPPPVPDKLADAPPLQKSRRMKAAQVVDTEATSVQASSLETGTTEVVAASSSEGTSGTGAIEAIACILAIQEGIVPPTINHFNDDEGLDPKLNLTFNKAQKKDVKVALSNTFGFGGHNASIILKKAG